MAYQWIWLLCMLHCTEGFNTHNGETGAQITLSLATNGSVYVTWSVAEIVDSSSDAMPSIRYAQAGSDITSGSISLATVGSVWNGMRRHSAELTGVVEGEEYSYQCKIGSTWTTALRFKTPARWSGFTQHPPTTVTRIALIGDLNAGTVGTSVIEGIVKGASLDVVLHLGNVADTLNKDGSGKQPLMDTIEPVSSAVPYMALPAGQDTHALAAYTHMFQRPSTSSNAIQDPWYSFE
eukprot:5641362-Amphidinium_carterae.1